MVPKLHAKGSSFKGAAAYLLHDKDRAQSSERVAWTETRNLAADDPDIAWRIMAATALDQGRLKEQAGVKNTGRKSDKHVLHFTLAWHPEQEPNRDEMMKAANGAIKVLGASGHQAMIIAHNDEKHPHLHIMINRVSPEDGRHLSSSKEKLKLSRWAEAYEKESGEVFCEQRVVNNMLRSQGHYVRGDKNAPRHIFEEQKAAAANDNRFFASVRDGQKAKNAAIAKRGREQAKRHKAEWQQLEATHRQDKADIVKDTKRGMARVGAKIIDANKPKILEALRRQRAEFKTFDALEKTLFGRTRNAITGINLLQRVYGEERGSLISRGFAVLARAGARREIIEKAHAKELRDIKVAQNQKIRTARQELKEHGRSRVADLQEAFKAKRNALVVSHGMDAAELRISWRERRKDRAAAWEKFADFSAKRGKPRREFQKVSTQDSASDGYKASVLAQHARQVMGKEPKDVANQNKDRDTDS